MYIHDFQDDFEIWTNEDDARVSVSDEVFSIFQKTIDYREDVFGISPGLRDMQEFVGGIQISKNRNSRTATLFRSCEMSAPDSRGRHGRWRFVAETVSAEKIFGKNIAEILTTGKFAKFCEKTPSATAPTGNKFVVGENLKTLIFKFHQGAYSALKRETFPPPPAPRCDPKPESPKSRIRGNEPKSLQQNRDFVSKRPRQRDGIVAVVVVIVLVAVVAAVLTLIRSK